METEELIKPGRPVYIKTKNKVGTVLEYVDVFHMWRVETPGSVGTYYTEELEPLFTLNQVVSVKVEDDTTPALVKKVIPFGMSSDDLAEEIAEFIAECTARIKGVGKDQYEDGGHQKFEEMELDDLFEYAEEELRDIANYAAFLVIRLRRIRAALNAADDLGDGTEEEYAGGTITADDFKED